MRRLIKAIIAWTERKWPDKVVVTQKDYDFLNARIKYLEAEVTKFNASLGFGGSLKTNGEAAFGPFQR